MSKKVDLLLDEPCPELLCGLCSDVLEDPMQVHCPEDHMFCSHCIHKYVEQGQTTCPLCYTTLDKNSFQLSKFVQRQIGRLRIKCTYANNGCLWQGLLSDNHIAECEYKPCVCPNAENGCTATNLSSSNMQQHMETCLYQIIPCPNNMPMCQPFLRKDLAKHESECQSYSCPYASEGCPYTATLTQVRIHCEGYCGRLHKKVQDLEMECKRLNSLIHDFTVGLNIKLPSTPETNMQEDQQQQQQQQQQSQQQQQADTSMDEMALFHQMFNSDPFGALDLNDTKSTPVNTPTSMMDLSTVLPDMSFLDSNNSNNNHNGSTSFNALFETATSPQPLQFIPPVNVPKRTSNGKKIRYSKNVRLAHSALRIARQRTASNNNTATTFTNHHNPSNDAILNNLDIAKQKSLISFKNIDDVTQFLNADLNKSSPLNTNTKALPSTTIKKEKKRNNSTTSISTTTATATKSIQQHESLSPQVESVSSPPSSNAAPKRRPMFILASSYLSNYNSNSNNDP